MQPRASWELCVCESVWGCVEDLGNTVCEWHWTWASPWVRTQGIVSLCVAPWHSVMCGTVAAAKSLQSCPTLCDPIDGSPQGSPIPGILQARTLEWVAISFSNAWKWKVKGKSFNWKKKLPGLSATKQMLKSLQSSGTLNKHIRRKPNWYTTWEKKRMKICHLQHEWI